MQHMFLVMGLFFASMAYGDPADVVELRYPATHCTTQEDYQNLKRGMYGPHAFVGNRPTVVLETDARLGTVLRVSTRHHFFFCKKFSKTSYKFAPANQFRKDYRPTTSNPEVDDSLFGQRKDAEGRWFNKRRNQWEEGMDPATGISVHRHPIQKVLNERQLQAFRNREPVMGIEIKVNLWAGNYAEFNYSVIVDLLPGPENKEYFAQARDFLADRGRSLGFIVAPSGKITRSPQQTCESYRDFARLQLPGYASYDVTAFFELIGDELIFHQKYGFKACSEVNGRYQYVPVQLGSSLNVSFTAMNLYEFKSMQTLKLSTDQFVDFKFKLGDLLTGSDLERYNAHQDIEGVPLLVEIQDEANLFVQVAFFNLKFDATVQRYQVLFKNFLLNNSY